MAEQPWEQQEKKYLDVKVCIEEGTKKLEQIIQQVQITQFIDEVGGLYLRKLLLILKQEFNLGFQMLYFLKNGEIWINCGIDPVSQDLKIRCQDWQEGPLMLRAKDLGVSLVHRLMSFDNLNVGQQKERTCADQMAQRSKCRRTKERRIGHIIDKVIEWRKYYSGVINEKNQHVKYSLEDAAKEVKISKKSLDDYLFQIRFGHRYGFNFNEHYNDKVGVLRDFVRQRKKSDKVDNKNKKNQAKQQFQEDDI